MGNGTIDFGRSLVYSGLGLTVVFLALVSLAIMIVVFSKVFSAMEKAVGAGESPQSAAVPDAGGDDLDTVAAILAAVTADAAARRENVVVTSINEIGRHV
jgi:Na+-transporting methylmalonyl-CoA/oxaloacetate decarboxylase gamma subunit